MGAGDNGGLSKDGDVAEFDQTLDRNNPFLLVGRPPCTYGTKLNVGFNYPRMEPTEVQERIKRGRQHIVNCVKFYRKQMDEGRYILHESLEGNLSWAEPGMVDLMQQAGVYLVKSPMCGFGMWAVGAEGLGMVKKQT